MRPQLIIPMSGLGKRFLKQGYTLPKPLIRVLGKPIIAHVLEMFDGWDDVLFIVNQDHLQNKEFDMERTLLELKPSGKVVPIKSHNYGPSFALHQAKEFITKDRPVVVNYCDFAGEFDSQEYEKQLQNNDSVLLTYTGFHPHMLRSNKFAYVKKSPEGAVIDIQEKEPYTDNPMGENASAGSYGFRNGSLLIDAIEKQMQAQMSLNGEFYTSLTLKPILENGSKVVDVQMRKFFQWGTPEDLADFEYWSEAISLVELDSPTNRDLKPQTTLILAAGSGTRIANKSNVPKPALLVFKKKLWEMSERSCSKNSEIYLITQAETFPFLDVPKYVKSIVLNQPTRGQADSAIIGVRAIEDTASGPLHILASDNVLPKGFTNTAVTCLEDRDLNFVVWTVKNYPPALLQPHHISLVKIESSLVVDAVYKEAPSLNDGDWRIISGNFTFKDKAEAYNLIANLLDDSSAAINDEFYLDSLISSALESNLRIGVVEIPNYFSLGTADEIDTFRYWSQLKEVGFHD
jgi:NDP-sugar pyrophosphorylase family protein